MTDLKTFSKHYGLDPTSLEAADQYQEYQASLAALYSVAAKEETQEAIQKAREAQSSGTSR